MVFAEHKNFTLSHGPADFVNVLRPDSREVTRSLIRTPMQRTRALRYLFSNGFDHNMSVISHLITLQ